jgi:hypothetical protein
MRAGLRLGIHLAAAGLITGPASALAQTTPPATATTPATDSVGPRDLQNFSLKGTVTRRAEQPAPAPASKEPTAPQKQVQAAPPPIEKLQTTPAQTAKKAPQPTEAASVAPSPVKARNPEPLPQSPPTSSVTVSLPALGEDPVRGAAAAVVPAADPSPGLLAPERGLALLPWLLAALALGAGGAFLLWRNRSREAFAGGPEFDSFVAPEPEPAPVPPTPPPAPPATRKRVEPSIPGIVSTRLRPWIEIGFEPQRFIVENEKVAIEFEIELFNSGTVPARAVLLEAKVVNAGDKQDEELTQFFTNPVGQGERIIAIPPLKRVTVRTQVAVPREHIQVFEVGDRKVCVPLIAFNALYGWSGGEGQTSVSYLFGRDTKTDKLAPFRLDLGPRLFRGLGARQVPGGLRT